MAYPASTNTLKAAFDQANGVAVRMKRHATTLLDRSAAGTVPRMDVVQFMRDLHQAIVIWDATRAITGIVEYARTEFAQPTLDVAGEFLAMRTAAATLRDWIYNNFPKDANGLALIATLQSDGTLSDAGFTTAQLATFRTNATSFINTIG